MVVERIREYTDPYCLNVTRNEIEYGLACFELYLQRHAEFDEWLKSHSKS